MTLSNKVFFDRQRLIETGGLPFGTLCNNNKKKIFHLFAMREMLPATFVLENKK